jgi:predicted dehydrogenase
MIAESKVRFGLIGAGGIAQAYVDAFAHSTGAELIGVTDVSIEAAVATARKAGCDHYPSVTAMCDAAGPDAVIICTPPSTHPELSIQCVDEGVHVLCEKPFAVDSSSARDMIDAARQNGVQISMASKFRHVPDVARAKELIAAGTLGEVRLFENVFTGYVDMSARWNADPAIGGGGVVIDNGTHSVDIARYLFGPVGEILAVEGSRYQPIEVEDTARLFVRTQTGIPGEIDLSWSISKPLPAFLTIYGTSGMLQVGWKESKYKRASDKDWTVFGNGYDKVAAFRRQIEGFARSIRRGEPLVVTPEEALASVDVIEAAYQALHQGRWQTVRYSGQGPRLFVPTEERFALATTGDAT